MIVSFSGIIWKKLNKFQKEIPYEPMLGLGNHMEKLIALEPIDLFFKYLPQQYLSHVANMSSLYAKQKGSSLNEKERTFVLAFCGRYGDSYNSISDTEESFQRDKTIFSLFRKQDVANG